MAPGPATFPEHERPINVHHLALCALVVPVLRPFPDLRPTGLPVLLGVADVFVRLQHPSNITPKRGEE